MTDELSPGEVHLWTAACLTDAFSSTALRVLSADERVRLDRFLDRAAAARFVTGRWLARSVLSAQTGVPAASITFEYSARGKPALSAGHGAHGLCFSLSHAAGTVVFALARREVGVDIEKIRPGWFGPGLIARVFGEREQALIGAAADADRASFRLWVRKEACLKALGTGLAGVGALDVVDDLCVELRSKVALHCRDISFENGYLGAVALHDEAPFTPIVRAWRPSDS